AAAREWLHAAEYYLHASNTEAYMFAFRESAMLARRGVEAVGKAPASQESSRLELALQLALGRPLALTGGASEPAAVACFQRASELAREIGDDIEIFPAIFGFYVVRVMTGDWHEALAYSRQLVGIAAKSNDPVALAQAHHAVAFVHESRFELNDALRHADLVLAGDRLPNARYVANFNVDPVIGCEWIKSRILWTQGLSDQAVDLVQATMQHIACEETDLRSTCYTFMIACVIHQYRGDYREVLAHAASGLEFCRKHGFEIEVYWFGFFEGWAGFAMHQAGVAGEADSSLDDSLG